MSQGVKFILQGRKTLRRKSGIFIQTILLIVGPITGTTEEKTMFYDIVAQSGLSSTEPLKSYTSISPAMILSYTNI